MISNPSEYLFFLNLLLLVESCELRLSRIGTDERRQAMIRKTSQSNERSNALSQLG
jgi:hypothetical protein